MGLAGLQWLGSMVVDSPQWMAALLPLPTPIPTDRGMEQAVLKAYRRHLDDPHLFVRVTVPDGPLMTLGLTRYLVGVVYIMVGSPEEAIPHLSKAYRNPIAQHDLWNRGLALTFKGLAHRMVGDIKGAALSFSNALEVLNAMSIFSRPNYWASLTDWLDVQLTHHYLGAFV